MDIKVSELYKGEEHVKNILADMGRLGGLLGIKNESPIGFINNIGERGEWAEYCYLEMDETEQIGIYFDKEMPANIKVYLPGCISINLEQSLDWLYIQPNYVKDSNTSIYLDDYVVIDNLWVGGVLLYLSIFNQGADRKYSKINNMKVHGTDWLSVLDLDNIEIIKNLEATGNVLVHRYYNKETLRITDVVKLRDSIIQAGNDASLKVTRFRHSGDADAMSIEEALDKIKESTFIIPYIEDGKRYVHMRMSDSKKFYLDIKIPFKYWGEFSWLSKYYRVDNK